MSIWLLKRHKNFGKIYLTEKRRRPPAGREWRDRMDIKDILSKCDHTLLRQDSTWEEIRRLCDE